jgi:hypothetical protein
MATAPALPRHVIDQLDAIRTQVRDIIPGGRDPERSHMAKDEAIRGIDRLLRAGRG